MKRRWPLAFMGMGLGLLPVILAVFILYVDTNFNAFAVEILNNKFIWIISLSPIVLGLFSYYVGIKQEETIRLSEQLRAQYEEQSVGLARTQMFFESLVQSNPLAVVQLDEEHKVISINESFTLLFDYTEKEIIGRDFDPLITSEAQFESAKRISSVVIDGEFVRTIEQRVKKGGEVVDVEIIGIPVFMGGEKIGGIGIYHDISSQIKINQTIKESEARFRTLFEDSPIPIWEQDYSKVKESLDRLGDIDIQVYFEKNPTFVEELINAIQVIDVN